MKMFDVYPLQQVTPVKGKGSILWDEQGQKYLDLYGAHAVISIGHSDPRYIKAISGQVADLGFYSNSVLNPLQPELAQRLGQVSGYNEYNLFLCNSGAEAVEQAIKLASFHTNRKKVVSIKKGFHGRTSLAVSVTDSPSLSAPVNQVHDVVFAEMNDLSTIERFLSGHDVAVVIIEGIQGIAGIYEPEAEFLLGLESLCAAHNSLLLIDEIQSGYGRTGKFFAHQHVGVTPNLITVAKGMGNGFPIGGVLIHPEIKASFGLLGTTFGGTHMACAAALAVLQVIEEDHLMANATLVGNYLKAELQELPGVEVRGRGLMIGLEFSFGVRELRKKLLSEFHIFTGVSNNPNVLRILPPLCLTVEEAHYFVNSLKKVLTNETVFVSK